MDDIFLKILNMSIAASWLILAVVLLRLVLKRAPKWMQEIYLEWLYRLIQDPKRLLKRYMFSNMEFIWLILTGH